MGVIRRLPEPDLHAGSSRKQFSLLFILGVLSVVAVLLGLSKIMMERDVNDDLTWVFVAGFGLLAVVFTVNMLMAVWAMLSPGPVVLRSALIFGIAAVLGLGIGAASLAPSVAEGAEGVLVVVVLIQMVVASVFATMIVMLSLWFLRSFGYRLVKPEQV